MIGKQYWLAWMVLALPGLAFAQDYAQSWGPPVGSLAPPIEAENQDGLVHNLESLAGEQGLLLLLSRSADW